MPRTKLLTLALLALCTPLLAQAPPKVPDGVAYEPDIEFGSGGDVKLALDLARPEKLDKPAPCIVFIHGGGWQGGNRKLHVDHILKVAQRGYVSATIQYRLVPTATWPAQIEDVKCAIRYLRANAEKYKLDPDRIGAVGFSAGAHLSLLLGTMDKKDGLEGTGGHGDQSSKVNAVVAYFGPTDLAAEFPTKPFDIPALIQAFLGGTAADKAEAYKAASPITYVDKGDAPTLIYHGTKDALVPFAQATAMAEAMTKAGMPGRIELLIGANHGWGGPEQDRTGEGSAAFFEQHLK
jgi:acetyl esterase/lipase